jgi:phospholipid-binding lipoprotein MlaA
MRAVMQRNEIAMTAPDTLTAIIRHGWRRAARAGRALATGTLCLAIAACATTTGQTATKAGPAGSKVSETLSAPDIDPYEPFNRNVFAFNDALDRNLLAPVARGYRTVVPEPVRRCVTNVFGNIDDAWSSVNSLLQGKPADCAQSVMRVATNTVFGIVGCIDVASQIDGLERKNEDFGQTLAVWGVSSGPYLVLPLLGPSTARDGVGRLADMYASPVGYVGHTKEQVGIWTTHVISMRANLLDASKVLDDAAPDRYLFYRDAYLQRREYLIYDGNPPQRKQPDEEWFDETAPAPDAKKPAPPKP